MNEVAADVVALRDFVDETHRWTNRLVETRDRLATQRLGLSAALPARVDQLAIGLLDEIIGDWDEVATFVASVRADLLTADQEWLFEGGAPRGRFGLPSTGEWTAADIRRLVELGTERTRLRGQASLDTASGLRARRRLTLLDAEMAELANRMDAGGWSAVAYLRAGVDPDWSPANDLVDNDANVRGIYRFYGDLYLENPDLLWAGMAGLVGRQLYAGWQDLYTARHLLDDGSRTKYLLELAGIPTGPDAIYDVVNVAADLTSTGSALLSPVQTLASNDLEWLETKMLSMAKEIFDDVGWVHMAYHYGDLQAVEDALQSAQRWDVRAMFRMIDSGDPDLVWRATRGMIVREQRDTIQDNWDEIHDRHGPVGELMTRFLSWTADSPIPGGRPYREVMRGPTGIAVPVPELHDFDWDGDLGQPFISIDYEELEGPVGNVAEYDDRKQWIDREIGPSFLRLATEHPDRLVAILDSPIDARVDEQRLHPLPYPGER